MSPNPAYVSGNFPEADFWPGTTSRHSAFTRSKKYPESRSFFDPNFRVARDPGASGIDSHKPALVLISQACLRRHLSAMMDRIAKGPEDVKRSVRAADDDPSTSMTSSDFYLHSSAL